MKHLLSLFFLITLSIQAHSQGKMIPQLGHQEDVIYMQFSEDGKWLATGGRDRVILLWDMQTGLHWTLEGLTFVVTGLSISPDGSLVAASDGRGKIVIWSTHDKNIKYQKDLKKNVGDIHFLPEHKGLLYSQGMVSIWDYQNSRTRSTYMTATVSKSSVSITPDGKKRIATLESVDWSGMKAKYSYSLSVNNIVDGSYDNRSDLLNYGRSWKLNAINGDGTKLALADNEKIVVVDFHSGDLIKSFRIEGEIRTLDISKKGDYVIGAYDNGKVEICDTNTGHVKSIASVTGSKIIGGLIAYDPTNELVAGFENRTMTMTIYDVQNDVIINKFNSSVNQNGSLRWDDRNKVLWALNSHSVVKWNLNTLRIEDYKYFPSQPFETFRSGTMKYFHEKSGSFLKGEVMVDGRSRHASANYYFIPNYRNKKLDIYHKSSKTLFKSLAQNDVITGTALDGDEKKLFVATIFEVKVYDFPNLNLIKTFPYPSGAPSTMRTSYDGRYIAVGKTSETVGIGSSEKPLEFDVDIYDTQTLALHKKLKGHYGTLVAMTFTPDGRLFTGSFDGKINFWDYEQGKLLATLHGTDPNYYFITTQKGFYTLSKSAIDRVAYGNEKNIYPAAQFEIKMNRPDKVASVFGYTSPGLELAYSKAYQKRIKQLDVVEGDLNLDELPKVDILTKIPRTSNEKTISFEIKANDDYYNLAYLKIMVNNVPEYQGKGLSIKSSQKLSKKIDLTLSQGTNHVAVSVVNERGAESAPATFVINSTQKVRPNLYVLAIGVSDFEQDDFDLTYAAKDALDLTTYFQTKKQDYGKIKINSITDKKATKKGILDQEGFFSDAKVDDEVILFVASHGLLDDQLDYYIATTDMNFEMPSEKGIRYDELEKLLTKTKARNRLLMIDACHSGEVDKEDITLEDGQMTASVNVKNRGFKNVKSNSAALGLKNSFELMKELFADMRNSSGATIISSASGTEFALESDEWKNGVFTYAVLNGLKSESADLDNDDYISVTELKSYVFDEVETLTNGLQHPTSRIENLKNDFIVASTKNASVTKFNAVGKWTNEYTYFGEKRKRYYEVLMNGVDLDVYAEAMEDYSKKWMKSETPTKYKKIGPNQYRAVFGEVIEMRDDNTLVAKDLYGASEYDKIYKRSTSNAATNTPVKKIANNTNMASYASPYNGTWQRADGKTDANGAVSSVDISGTADGGLSVTFSSTKKNFKYKKVNDGLYEFKLGSLIFKVEKNKDGSLTINKYKFKR